VAVDELRERFAELQHPPDDSDWLEVVRLARSGRRARSRLAVLVAAVVAIVAAAPAFGLGGDFFKFFQSGEPAPPRIVRSFARLDAGAPPGFETGVVAKETRKIVMPGGVALWIAPTAKGGFCLFVDGGGGQCDATRALAFWPAFSIGGRFTRTGVIDSGPVLIDGWTTLKGASSVEIRFEDGHATTIPVVWISAPIDAGFFGYRVPPAQWRVGRRPVLLILRDSSGNELRRDSSAFDVPEFRHGPSTGLAPCIVRGGGDACFQAVFGHDLPVRHGRRAPVIPPGRFSQPPWRGK
jgi:hypothetical protein